MQQLPPQHKAVFTEDTSPPTGVCHTALVRFPTAHLFMTMMAHHRHDLQMACVQSRQQQALKERRTGSKVSKNSASSHFHLHKNYKSERRFEKGFYQISWIQKLCLSFIQKQNSIFRNTSSRHLWPSEPLSLDYTSHQALRQDNVLQCAVSSWC